MVTVQDGAAASVAGVGLSDRTETLALLDDMARDGAKIARAKKKALARRRKERR